MKMILFSEEKLGVVQSICFPSTLKTIKLAIDWTINWTIDWTVNNDQALTDQRNHQLALVWHLSLLKSTLPHLFSLFCPNLPYLPRFSFYPIGLMFLHMVDMLMVSTFVITLSCLMMSLSLLMFWHMIDMLIVSTFVITPTCLMMPVQCWKCWPF